MWHLHMVTSILTNVLTLILFAAISSSTDTCYLPDGTSEDTAAYQPCDKYSNSGTRMCCGTLREIPSGGNGSLGFAKDTCLQNGLCMNQGIHPNGETWNRYWREGCTSSDWSAGGCLNVCVNDKNGGSAYHNVEMTPCDGSPASDYWCCGQDNIECCNTADAVFVHQPFSQRASNQSIILQDASNQTGDDSSHNVPHPGMSPGVKGAIGGGIAAGFLLLGVVVLWVLKRTQGQERQELPNPRTKGPVELNEGSIRHEIGLGNVRHEKAADLSSTRFEIGLGNVIYEKSA